MAFVTFLVVGSKWMELCLYDAVRSCPVMLSGFRVRPAVGAQADEDTAEARKLADQYQPIIIEAERDKRDSDFHFQEFAHATHEVRSCSGRRRGS